MHTQLHTPPQVRMCTKPWLLRSTNWCTLPCQASSESEDVGKRNAGLVRASEGISPTCVSEPCPSSSSGLPYSDRSSRERSPSMVTLKGYAGAVVSLNRGNLAKDGVVGSKFFTWTVGEGHLKSLLENGAVACGSVKEFLGHLPRDIPAKHWLDCVSFFSNHVKHCF